MTDREPYRDDVRDALARAGWTEDAHGALVAPNGALWAETSPALDSCMDAHDNSWTLACDSDVPATVIVAAALAAAGQNEPDTAGKATRKGEATLSSDVLDLLAAIRDMANVPLPTTADADERAWQNLMSRRLSELHTALDVALSPKWADTLNPATDAAHLRKRLAEMPVTYALYEQDGDAR